MHLYAMNPIIPAIPIAPIKDPPIIPALLDPIAS